jgi:hypothetical protein
LTFDVSYGRTSRDAQIAGHPGRLYELGPAVDPDDIDGRMPAVVVWHDAEMLYLVASDSMQVDELAKIAASLYPVRPGRFRRK